MRTRGQQRRGHLCPAVCALPNPSTPRSRSSFVDGSVGGGCGAWWLPVTGTSAACCTTAMPPCRRPLSCTWRDPLWQGPDGRRRGAVAGLTAGSQWPATRYCHGSPWGGPGGLRHGFRRVAGGATSRYFHLRWFLVAPPPSELTREVSAALGCRPPRRARMAVVVLLHFRSADRCLV